MIVMKQPSALRLFFIMQGSVVPRIIDKIIGVAILSALVLMIDKFFILFFTLFLVIETLSVYK